MNPLQKSEWKTLKKLDLQDLGRKVEELVEHINDKKEFDEMKEFEKEEKELFFEEMIRERITDMLFDCYPSDMENFETMTDNQAYRLLNKFWKKIGNL